MWSAGNRTRPRIGRPETWAALLRREQTVRDGDGRLTLLEGVPGVGKSTFLRLLAEQASQASFRAVSVGATASENPPPFQLMSAALREVDLHVPAVRSKGGPAPASVVFLPAFDGGRGRVPTTDPLGAMMDDARSESASDRLRFMDSLASAFFDRAKEAPLLLTIDDLQLADGASLAFLQHILPRLAGHSLWIVGTVVELERSPEPDGLSALRSQSSVEQLRLSPLSEAEVAEYARWLVPHRPLGEAEVRRVHAQSEGIPRRLEQLLSPPSQTRPPAATARTSARESAASMLAPYSAEGQRVLILAAVAGMEVSLDLLGTAAGLSEERTVEHLERFIGSGILHEVEDGRFAFDREETRVSICAELGTRRLQLYHRKIAEALEQSGSLDMATVFALARHTYLGGQDREALRYNQQAAAFAAGAFQPALALFYLRHALELLPANAPDDASTEFQLHLAIAVQLVQMGETEEAETELREIQASERLWQRTTADDRALWAVYRARVLSDEGRWEEAERSLAELPPEFERVGPVGLRRAAVSLRGEILFYRGEYLRALAADEAAVTLAEEEGQPREVAAAKIRHATALTMLPGRAGEAIAEFQSAIDELVRLGDYSEAAFGALCLGSELTAAGDPERARQALERSVDLAERAHDARRAGWAHVNLADLELAQGRTDEAVTQARRARESLSEVEDAFGRARAALIEGRLALASGDYDLAQQNFELARGIFSNRHLAVVEIEVELRATELDLARHDEAGARDRLERIENADLPRLRPDLVPDWERIRRQLGSADPASS